MTIERASTAGIILLLCATLALVDARRRRDGDAEDSRADMSSQAGALVNPTYLDTLNSGTEFFLRESDLAVISSTASSAPEAGSGSSAPVSGFRIQCYASNNIETVRAQKNDAEEKTGLETYIVFAEPYYKLQAGDFLSRADAEKALARIKTSGYPEAWIVSGPVNIKR